MVIYEETSDVGVDSTPGEKLLTTNWTRFPSSENLWWLIVIPIIIIIVIIGVLVYRKRKGTHRAWQTCRLVP